MDLPLHVPTVMAENSTSLSGLHAPSETMGRCGNIKVHSVGVYVHIGY